MSPQTRTLRDGSTRPTRHRAVQRGAVVWLTAVWVALWGDLSLLTVLSGVLVAVLVCLVFPLPPLSLASTVHPLRLAALIGRFLVDIVHASIQVTVVVLRRRPVRNAVVAVDLESSSDFVLTAIAAMLSLVPGSVVVEARRSTHTLYLHVLDVPDAEAAEEFRRSALDLERRFLAALPPRVAPARTDGGAR